MTKNMLTVLMAASLSGCAGVSITPISAEKVKDAHTSRGDVKGYIVYAPIIAVEVSAKLICVKQTKDKCDDYQVVCAAGTPFVLPDYTKPYAVEVRTGLGKAGVDIALKDGWLITNIKDTSDNTALLGFIEKLVLAEKKAVDPGATGTCPVMGLYRINVEKDLINLQPLKLYK